MNRRQWIGVGAALAAYGSNGFSRGELSGKIRIAVKYHMINDPNAISVMDKFQLLKETGFDGTELKTRERVDVNEVKAASEKFGIPVHGIVNAGDIEIAPAIELAKKLNSETVLSFAAPQKGFSFEENFKFWQSRIESVLPEAEKSGIVICIENVRNTFLKEAEQMARFIDSFDTPHVNSYFDLGNTITWTEQPAEHWARVLGERIQKLDIKDRGHPVFGEPKLMKPGAIGTNRGEVNWRKVREILIEHSFSGWATAEVRGGDRERLAGIANWIRDVLEL